MARKLGPKIRYSRRIGEALIFTAKESKVLSRRASAPGQHGAANQRLSGYGQQLREKQKAKLIYGLLERQFHRNFEEALGMTGDTGEILLQLLERRLDNVVYRAGWATTRAQARQLVSHGHISVNGKAVNIPSYRVRTNELVKVRGHKKDKAYFINMLPNAKNAKPPAWLKVDAEDWSVTVVDLPKREDIEHNLKPQLIVEFYSR
jgi:small subunit ribosomal protein S4